MVSRLFVFSAIALGALAFAMGPLGAAPENAKKSQTLTVTCAGQAPFAVLVNGGGPAFDVSISNGRIYELLSIEGRAYAGSFTTEPMTTPIFVFAHDYGNRNGYTVGPFVCTTQTQDTFNGMTITTFLDLVAVSK